MELTTDSTQSARSFLTIDLNESPSFSSSDTHTPDAFSLVRRFHDDLSPPVGSPAELPGVFDGSECPACGLPEDRGDVVVCDGCERGFHLRCAFVEGQQIDEWECGECIGNAVPCNRWPLGVKTMDLGEKSGGVRLLDINSLPISDGEGEGITDVPHFRKRTPGDNSFGVPVAYSKLLHDGKGFDFQKASGVVLSSVKCGFEDILRHKQTVHRIFEEVDSHSLPKGLRSNNCTAIELPNQYPVKMYLQALREYILERHGVLEEGWRVEFKQSITSGEQHAVYCAPDGKTFESMTEVASYLGLISNGDTVRPEIRSYAPASPQVRLQYPNRRNYGSAAVGHVGKSGNYVKVIEAGVEHTGGSESQQLNDGLPVQYEDFFVLSVGKIVARSSYHNVNQIWPVGFRSCWHDKITGSLFTSEVLDGGDFGPVFKVTRRSCSVVPIPDGSTVLCRPKRKSDRQNEEKQDDMTCNDTDYDGDLSVLMFLSEPSPPGEDDILSCLGSSSSEYLIAQPPNRFQLEGSPVSERSGNLISDNLVFRDEIGEFSIEGSSSSSAWSRVSKTLIHACRKIYMQTGTIKFFCKHVADGTCSSDVDVMYENYEEKFVSLAKFCGISNSIDIPSVIRSYRELETFTEVLTKWLDQDRFGVDVEFVQEIVEQLPGAQACSSYVFLNERNSYSSSIIVGNGNLQVKAKDTDEETVDVLFKGCKGSRTRLVEDPLVDDHCLPPGNPISSRVPPQLVGDVLQVWEFLWRFYNILDFKEPLSIEELEKELVTPWFDGLDLVEKFGREIREIQDVNSHRIDGTSEHVSFSSTESGPAMSVESPNAFIQMGKGPTKEAAQASLASVTYSRCTGFALTKVHNSLVRVLVSELQSKVAAVADPKLDSGELKSKRGRKKDRDCWITAKRTKLNMLPLNELTWPELIRRYILAVLSMDGNHDSAEVTVRESAKVFRCLQGDGGVLCGSLTGVAGIEADAQLLAESAKKIFGSLNRQNDILFIDDEESDGTSSSEKLIVNEGGVPEWAKVLEPVRKLPTNVGARIKRCVNDALEKCPPEWAKKILEHSISKEVYKGNASGPTKKAVLSVLANVCAEGLQHKPDMVRKKKKSISISDIIMKQCRIVLRRAAAADEAKIFCNLLGRKLINCSDNDDEGILGSPAMVSRPLDFRTIDLRLAVGVYSGSHEAFHEDVREFWTNVLTACGDQPDLVQSAQTLSHNFESLYEKEVVTLFHKLVGYTKLECVSAESKKEIDELLISVSEIPKAPWEEGVCKVCGVDRDDDSVLLCDTCDAEYHTYCLNPPLARIPEGNWFCPSCVSGKHVVHDASEGTQVIRRHRKKIGGEVTRVYLDSLAHLAAGMQEREYWELSVEERTFLLKFLCDELLNSALIRQHLEQSTETSTDLQQKLRSLYVEWKTLKSKEEKLTLKTAKVERCSLKSVGRVMGESSANALTNSDKCIEQPNTLIDKGDSLGAFSDDHSQRKVGQICSAPVGVEDQAKYSQAVVGDSQFAGNSYVHVAEFVPSNLDQQGINELERENVLQVNVEKHIMGSDSGTLPSSLDPQVRSAPFDKAVIHTGENVSPMDVNKSQSDGVEMNSVGNGILLLQKSITSIETELMKLSTRREFLGRDSFGRLYWILAESGPHPLVTANGNVEFQQRGKIVCYSDANPISSTWVLYQSDAEIKELVDCLKENDQRERELKESILHWQKLRFQGAQQTENRNGEDPETVASRSANSANSMESFNGLITKAASLLEAKYGPCFQPQATDSLKKRSRKTKVTTEQKMYRCECLELVWQSKHHCVSCHKTFFTNLELEKHNDGKCNVVPPTSEKSKETSETVKGKGTTKLETGPKVETDIVNGLKSGGSEFSSSLIRFQNDGLPCPFDFEDICSKFVIKSSNKELVKEIGLIGSNGTPSFVSSVSPYLTDPALMLVPPQENVGVPKADEHLGFSQANNMTTVAGNYGSLADNSSICAVNDVSEAHKGDKAELKDDKSSSRSCASVMEVGNYCVVPKSSLRPLVGKASIILRQHKINLLDMDAVLNEEAVRPSKANSERRQAWCEFVKSAQTIYEMVQAIIVFEDMIRSDYLRNTWWYWSSLSAAAKISTLSALALRIYSLDAAINYEKISSYAAPPNKPSGITSDQNPQASSDSAEKTKPSRKTNKKRKDPES